MFMTVLKNPQGDDYSTHQIMAGIFDGQKILFQRRNLSVYVLSPLPPRRNVGRSICVKHVIDGIKTGDSLDFSIRINPTVSKKTENASQRRGVRKAVHNNDLKRWIDSKFIKYGFMADYSFEQEKFRESVKKGTVITISSVLISGTLEVLNPDSVRLALIEGIGRGKGLGFGMLHCYESLTV